MPKSGLRCDEISLSRVDADKTDPPTKNVACFAGQTHEMFGRRIWAGQVVDAPKETCRCALPRERCRSIFGCRWRHHRVANVVGRETLQKLRQKLSTCNAS